MSTVTFRTIIRLQRNQEKSVVQTLMLKTETPNTQHANLDQYSASDLVNAFADDQINAVIAVRAASAQLAAAVDAAVPRLKAGGRLIYVGAGTSGRLGLLDSVELYPTFSWPRERAIALLAGGREAIFQAVEGAEEIGVAGKGREVDVEGLGAADFFEPTNPPKRRNNEAMIKTAAA